MNEKDADSRLQKRQRANTSMVLGVRDRYGELAEASIALSDQGELVRVDNATHWIQHDEQEQLSGCYWNFSIVPWTRIVCNRIKSDSRGPKMRAN